MEIVIWILIGILVFNLLFLIFILWKYGAELSSNDVLEYEYDMTDMDNMYQDSEGKVPVTKEGDSVGLIKNKSNSTS